MRKLNGKKNSKNTVKRKRFAFVFLGLILLFLGLVIRLYFIMVIDGKELKFKAESQWSDNITLVPKRGKILDRNGQVLALSGDVYRIDADLSVLGNSLIKKKKTVDSLAEDLARILNLDKNNVIKLLQSKEKNGNPLKFISLKREIEKNEADGVKALNLNGLILSQDTKRYYPDGDLLKQVIGFTDIDGEGISGVELSYNKKLSGISGLKMVERDPGNNDLPFSESQVIKPVDGKDVVLTIDERIQEAAESVAEKALDTNKAESVSITIMNPKNGEILAIANKNSNSEENNAQQMWKNNAVQNVFEPGSIFKVIVAAAALENHAVTDTDRFIDNGSIKVGDTVLRSDVEGGFGVQSFSDILKNSSNVGFVELAQKIGWEKLYKYAQLMGFGRKTGVDLPGESSGIVKKFENIGPVDFATMSFGHGLAVTQMQYMAAFNAVANGGTWIRPHVLKSLVDNRGGNEQKFEGPVDYDKKTVMSEGNASKLRGYLETVVKEGTAKATYIEGYHIAGKTGTAEKVDTKKGGYEPNKYVSSFAGMAPASDPVVTLIVTIDAPNSPNYFAAATAVPAAKELFMSISNYMSISNKDSK